MKDERGLLSLFCFELIPYRTVGSITHSLTQFLRLGPLQKRVNSKSFPHYSKRHKEVTSITVKRQSDGGIEINYRYGKDPCKNRLSVNNGNRILSRAGHHGNWRILSHSPISLSLDKICDKILY
jgi:hypothetical protein